MFSQQIVKNDAFLHDIFTYPSSTEERYESFDGLKFPHQRRKLSYFSSIPLEGRLKL